LEISHALLNFAIGRASLALPPLNHTQVNKDSPDFCNRSIRNNANRYFGLHIFSLMLYWLLFPSAFVMRRRMARGRWVAAKKSGVKP